MGLSSPKLRASRTSFQDKQDALISPPPPGQNHSVWSDPLPHHGPSLRPLTLTGSRHTPESAAMPRESIQWTFLRSSPASVLLPTPCVNSLRGCSLRPWGPQHLPSREQGKVCRSCVPAPAAGNTGRKGRPGACGTQLSCLPQPPNLNHTTTTICSRMGPISSLGKCFPHSWSPASI